MLQLFEAKVLPSFFVLAQLYLQLLGMILEELFVATAAMDQAVRMAMDTVEKGIVVDTDCGMSAAAAVAIVLVVENSFDYMLDFQTLDDGFSEVVSKLELSVSRRCCCLDRATADC